ncbi:MAG: hypothetical protein ACI814_002867 [Mariniblastus sp.]|jgi:integrase
MARPKSTTAPKYRLHKPSGNAAVTINGKAYYLGIHGTAESKRKYRRLIADLWASGGELKPVEPKPDQAVTVSFLAVEFAKFAKRKYRKSNGDPKNEWFIVQNVLKEIRATYGDLPANEFGPLRFEEYRQSLVAKGLARHTVKRYANHAKKMFQRAVQVELIPVELFQRLDAVGPVEMEFKPGNKVPPVATEIVRATQNELPPLVADMVEVQLLTGMRPREVCCMRPCDINRLMGILIHYGLKFLRGALRGILRGYSGRR